METRQIARRVIGKPYEAVRDKRGTGRERVVRKHLQKVGKPADRLVPPLWRRERSAFIRRRDQHGATELEPAAGGAETLRTLDKVAKDEAATGMRDDVERRDLLRQAIDNHPRVLFGRAADGEVIEREHAVAIRACDTLKKRRRGQRPECRGRV